jgi:hypothetical protein
MSAQLGSATLPVQVFVVILILVLAALFLLSGLSALLAGLTLLLAGLVVLLSRLSALVTLLLIFLHIVCHKIVLPFRARDVARSVI